MKLVELTTLMDRKQKLEIRDKTGVFLEERFIGDVDCSDYKDCEIYLIAGGSKLTIVVLVDYLAK